MGWGNGLKTIVVAADPKGQAKAAFEYARRIAACYGARIILAHGLDPMEYAALGGVPESVLSRLNEAARAELERMASELIREGIHSHSEVRQGAVVDMLLDVARQYDAGLIVVGTKARGGAGAVVVGAITESLVRAAPCPVLAVAEDWRSEDAGPEGPVLLAVDRNEAAADAAAVACSLAKAFQRPLLMLHVRTAAEQATHFDPCALMAEQGERQACAPAWECIVKDGDPASAVAEALAERKPCLLVLGVKRTSGTPGPHGTAFRLLAESRVPVLCVPPEAAGASAASAAGASQQTQRTA